MIEISIPVLFCSISKKNCTAEFSGWEKETIRKLDPLTLTLPGQAL